MTRITTLLLIVSLGVGWGAERRLLAQQPDQDQPPKQATKGPKPKPVKPITAAQLDGAIDRGVEFLLRDQNKDGSWGSPHRTKALNIYAPVPGSHHAFHTAVTSLCISAMIEAGGDSTRAEQSIRRGEDWLIKNLPKLRRATPTALYNTWGHAYSIQALVRMRRRAGEDIARRETIDKLIASQIEKLSRYEFVNGGWGYYDFTLHTKKPGGSPNSFTTATAMIALHEAAQIGISVPEKMISRARTSILRQRKPDFSYAYGEYLRMSPMRGINRPGGSLGRSQACNLALRVWGDKQVNDQVIETWLDRLFARNMWLDIGRKRPVPHEAWFGVAGYFFYYGHYYAALCIDQLPEASRARHQDQLAHILIKHQDKDGSWWDFPLYNYHQQYGTAFALMSLERCKKSSDK